MGRVGIPIERPIMQLDTGATAWMLISSSLVLLMTVPGLAILTKADCQAAGPRAWTRWRANLITACVRSAWERLGRGTGVR